MLLLVATVRLRGALGNLVTLKPPPPSYGVVGSLSKKSGEEQCHESTGPSNVKHTWSGRMPGVGKIQASAAQAQLSSRGWVTLSESLNLYGPPWNCQNRSKSTECIRLQ